MALFKIIALLLVVLVLTPCLVALVGIIYLLAADAIEQKHYWEDKRLNKDNQNGNFQN